jgi:Nitrous oxide-stimulated promoter
MTRIQREKRTVSAMIALYCQAHHPAAETPCAECRELQDYALARLDRCPFGDKKPTCAKCPIHCYKPDMKARIREVMRYAGPRMLRRHPLLAAMHQIDSLGRSGVSRTRH